MHMVSWSKLHWARFVHLFDACKAQFLNSHLFIFRLKLESWMCQNRTNCTSYLPSPGQAVLVHGVWRSDAFVHQTVWTWQISPSSCFKDDAARWCLHSNESLTSTRLPDFQMSSALPKTQPRMTSPKQRLQSRYHCLGQYVCQFDSLKVMF